MPLTFSEFGRCKSPVSFHCTDVLFPRSCTDNALSPLPQLYEAAMVENDKLQERLAEAQADCRDAKLNLDKALQVVSVGPAVPSHTGSVGHGVARRPRRSR